VTKQDLQQSQLYAVYLRKTIHAFMLPALVPAVCCTSIRELYPHTRLCTLSTTRISGVYNGLQSHIDAIHYIPCSNSICCQIERQAPFPRLTGIILTALLFSGALCIQVRPFMCYAEAGLMSRSRSGCCHTLPIHRYNVINIRRFGC
jgi:hypothetical protein